jgi:immune inhibitor A
MSRDAAVLANPDVNFAPYDNDGNGFVDAFIVVHAGPGAEETGNEGTSGLTSGCSPVARSTLTAHRSFAYLTIPEDSKIGVCAHELGHLIFGWPDLYDTDGSSEGLGNWCLMGGGSWNGSRKHPGASIGLV